MSVRIVFENLGELADELRRMPDQVQDEGSAEVHGAARVFASVMQSGFPRRDDTGHLRMNTQVAIEGALRAVVYNVVFYAAPIDFGWLHATGGRWVAGQEIWVPHAMRTRDDMIRRLREIVHRGRGLRLRALEVTP